MFSLQRLKEGKIAVYKYMKLCDKGNRGQLFSLAREKRSAEIDLSCRKENSSYICERCVSATQTIRQWNKLL